MTKREWLQLAGCITFFGLLMVVILHLESDLQRWVFAMTFAGASTILSVVQEIRRRRQLRALR